MGQNMNIWIWNHYATDTFKDKGGRHYWFAENLIKFGHKPTIFCASTVHNLSENIDTKDKKYIVGLVKTVPYVFIKTPSYQGNSKKRIVNMFEFYRNLFPTAKKYAEENGKPDVILASSVHPLTLVAGIKIAKKFNVPCICEVRDLWPESFVAYNILKKNNPILKILYAGEKWIYKKADKIIFTMEGGKQYIIDKKWDKKNGGPIDLKKIIHINNGVDMETYMFNMNNYLLEDADLKKNSYKVVYVGSLRKANDSVWRLVDVAELFQKEGNSEIQFLIYGDGSEKYEIENSILKKGLKNIKIKGYVDKKYIPYILSKCNLNVLNCSSWDVLKYGGSQNKLFDYLASGNPIISGEDSAYSIINNRNCGISKKFKTIDEIKDAILYLKNMNETERIKMKENIINVAYEYDYNNLTRQLINTIEGSEE